MTACSARASEIGETLPGTAPRNRSWVVLEHAGAFGRVALLDSGLPETLGRYLEDARTASSTGVLLARRAEGEQSHGTRIWLATCGPGASRMRKVELSEGEPIPHLEIGLIGEGQLPGLGQTSTDPVLFICTNGKRDVCCAVEGRSLVNALAADGNIASAVWESSHQGGHRFAPVALLLPHGYSYGRLTAAAATEVLQAARNGELPVTGLRGRTSLPRTAQAAEVIIRRSYDVRGIDDLDVLARDSRNRALALSATADAGPERMEVRHRDGRAWWVDARLEQLRPATPESCGKGPVERTTVVITRVSEAGAWR